MTQIEREWADYLLSKRQADAAISHFIEAGDIYRAIEAAVQAQQWQKATDLLYGANVDVNKIKSSIDKLAEYFLNSEENEKAAELFVKTGNKEQAVEALVQAGRFTEAYDHLGADETAKNVFLEKAQKEIDEGNLNVAEKLFLACDSADKAITTYHSLGKTSDCVRLAKIYYPDRLAEIYCSLAAKAHENGQLKEAERLYTASTREGYQEGSAMCIEMYLNLENYEDAMRVATTHGSSDEVQEVAYQWARTCLTGQTLSATGVKIIERYSSPEYMIERAMQADSGVNTENGQNGQNGQNSKNKASTEIEFARTLMKQFNQDDRLAELNSRFANALQESKGREDEAESYYLQADRPQEAIAMWIKKNEYGRALNTARQYGDEGLLEQTVKLVSKRHEEDGDVDKAINVCTKNGFVRQAIKMCMETGRAKQALGLAEEHTPELVPRLREYLVS